MEETAGCISQWPCEYVFDVRGCENWVKKFSYSCADCEEDSHNLLDENRRHSDPDVMERFVRMCEVSTFLECLTSEDLRQDSVQRAIDDDDPQVGKRKVIVALWVLRENLEDVYDRIENMVKGTLKTNGVKDYEWLRKNEQHLSKDRKKMKNGV